MACVGCGKRRQAVSDFLDSFRVQPITLDVGHEEDYMKSQYNQANARIPVTDTLPIAAIDPRTYGDDLLLAGVSQRPENVLQHTMPSVSLSSPSNTREWTFYVDRSRA